MAALEGRRQRRGRAHAVVGALEVDQRHAALAVAVLVVLDQVLGRGGEADGEDQRQAGEREARAEAELRQASGHHWSSSDSGSMAISAPSRTARAAWIATSVVRSASPTGQTTSAPSAALFRKLSSA